MKNKANGICGICNNKVPKDNLNKFYCSEPCRIKAWKLHHPEEVEPDWDSFPKIVYY